MFSGEGCIDFSDLSLNDDTSEVILASSNPGSSDDQEFDEVVGALEDILMREEFQEMQGEFCEGNCAVFEEGEESKLVYTELFGQYTELIEGYLQSELSLAIPDFSMDRFGALLSTRHDEITGDVLDMLMSFTDFEEFKGLMLSYKAMGAGGGEDKGGLGIDMCLGIVSKENLSVGYGGASVDSPIKGGKGGISVPPPGKDVLSPASREAKEAGL
eukprot:CAMPEP_0182457326 /NCGR_PEP_ID=MMETSP1319-20130603/2912_1 /TAXON_ID=172717 /ORGANISM="Bolidomonas pacifica, Strain RCC208" /LENGTH=214 /DNA_ID=CAMNT_0024655763 /DNA_START=241 /DNA_END=885 /DNA_ORIENTATION=+